MAISSGTGGRRARKKRQTAEAISHAAAVLFAERGYEHVTITDIAEAADVSEQTVYNHFPTKEHLVFDRAAEFEADLRARLQQRLNGTPIVDAIRDDLLELLDMVAGLPAERVRGGMPYLVASSPALRRWQLQMTAGHAETLAAILAEEAEMPSPDPATRIIAHALTAPYQVITDELGRRFLAGQPPRDAAHALRPAVNHAFNALARGLGGDQQ